MSLYDLTPFEQGWLVGILEGEGSFMAPSPSKPSRPVISIEMTDLDVIQRIATIFKAPALALKNRNPAKNKEVWRTTVGNKRAINWMCELRPFMSTRRQEQIKRALSGFISFL